MGFESLLGNERLKENLTSGLARGRISHFYLISGPEGSGKHTLARLLAAAILCTGERKPCHTCRDCRKALSGSHPDVITVVDPEHKTIPVDMIRDIREDAHIRPNEGAKKIYIFPQELRVEGQNALLKILEEPPAYGVFLLLTDTPEKLLPTVRSRCVELKLLPLPRKVLLPALAREFPDAPAEMLEGALIRSGGWMGQAKTLLSGEELPPQTGDFVRSYCARDELALIRVLVPMEKWKREQLIPMFVSWQALLEEALAARSGLAALNPLARQLSTARPSAELLAAQRCLQQAVEHLRGNVSTGAVCGWLEWELR